MISMTSEYALRAMVFLAAQPNGRGVLGRELAESAEIPANYLAKILVTLRNAGLVATIRGTGGGYLLQKPDPASDSMRSWSCLKDRAPDAGAFWIDPRSSTAGMRVPLTMFGGK